MEYNIINKQSHNNIEENDDNKKNKDNVHTFFLEPNSSLYQIDIIKNENNI